MLYRQQENKLFQEKDALMMEWDFIECNVQDKEDEICAKIVVKMDKETKIINLAKSTLTMEYSISDLKKKITQVFNISKDKNLNIFFNNKRIMITNDLILKQIIECTKDLSLELEVCLTQTKHCILCMRSDCHHLFTNAQSAEKKRKNEDSKKEINLLDPKGNSTSTSSSKKRRIASCSPGLKSSQNLLIGSFIF